MALIVRICLVAFSCCFISASVNAESDYVKPQEINLNDAPVDSIQHTMWGDFPIIIHRRTKEQIQKLKDTQGVSSSPQLRFLGYRQIAMLYGNETASVIRELSEDYIKSGNVYRSELPEFGIFSLVSPILGCALHKVEDGFVDPCNGAEFDFAGRAKHQGQYSHFSMLIPPHRIENNKLIIFNDYQVQELIDFAPDIMAMDLPPIDKALLAVDWDKLDVLKQLIALSPEVLTQSNSVGANLVHVAARHDTTLDYVLSFPQVEINKITDTGYSAFLFAMWMDKHANAVELYKRGAKLEEYEWEGNRAPSLYNFLTKELLYQEERAKQIVQGFKSINRTKVQK